MAFELVGKLMLVDQMSAPLRNAAGSLGKLGNATGGPARGLADLANSGGKVNAWGGSFNAGMQGVIGTLGKIATAVGATKIAMDTVKQAMSFDQRMTSIGSLSPEAKAARKELEGLAIEMGMKTKYSAIEAADSIENLVRAGRSVADILGGDLEGAMTLAAADEINLADAAMIVSDNLNAFAKDGMKAADVADILAGTSAAASTDVMGLQMGLKNVGSVAGSVGMTLKDTAAGLGLMANAGIKGSDAGTAMKTMLMRLQPKGKKARDMMKQLGIMTKKGENRFYNAKGELKSLAEISDILSVSMAKLTPQQRAFAMETMFGTDAVRAANVLYEAGAEGVNGFHEAMGRTTALQMASEKLDSASGAAEILKGILSTLQIVIGQALLPVIKDFCIWASDATAALVEWFQSAEGQSVLQSLTDGFMSVLEKVKAFCAWLGLVLSPLFNRVKEDISKVVSALMEWFASDDGAAWFEAIRERAEAMIERITAVYCFFTDNFTAIAPIIAGVVAAVWAFNTATAVLGVVTATSAAGGFAAAATAAWTFTAALLANPALWIAIAIGVLVAAVVALWLNWDSVSAWLCASWDAIKAKAEEIFGAIGAFLDETWASITSGITAAWENITTTISGAWDGIVTFFTSIDLSTVGSTIIDTLGAGISAAWEAITSGLPALWANVTGFFDGISLSSIGTNIINGLWEGLKSAWNNVTAWFGTITSAIPGWVKDALGIHSPSRVMMELGQYTMQGYAIGLDKEKDTVEHSAVSIAETPQRAVSGVAHEPPKPAPTTTGDGASSGTVKQVSFNFGDVILQGVGGDLRAAADEFMAIIAERLDNDGGLVPEGV